MRTTVRRGKQGVKFLLVIVLVSMFTASPCISSDAPDFLKLLNGYSIVRESTMDAVTWTIEKEGGLRIHFEAGFSEGMWVDQKDAHSYVWSRTQSVNGYKAFFALIKPGLRTRWEPKNSNGLPPGNVLLVTFLLDGERSFHTANFSAKITSDQELVDTLLMVMTFDPSKGTF